VTDTRTTGAGGFDLEQTDRLLTTTRAVRKRLDFEHPVDPAIVRDCIRLACHAPNASNLQEWRWIVVTDPELRRAIGDEYRRILLPLLRDIADERTAQRDAAGLRITAATTFLAEHLGEAPVLVIPCFEFRVEADTHLAWTARMFASMYPAVWSFQLALRSRGLGSTLTTAHLLDDSRIQALLEIPDSYTQTCLLPVAHTLGDDFKPAPRRPVDEIIGWNRWPD